MAQDLDFMKFIAQDPAVGILSVGQAGFDFYSKKAAYKEDKKKRQNQINILRSQAALEAAGINFKTNLTKQSIKASAETADNRLLRAGAQEVSQAAQAGAQGSAATLIMRNQEAKRLRQQGNVEVQLDTAAGQGQAALSTLDAQTDIKAKSIWDQRASKPSALTSITNSAIGTYNAYKAELTLRKKADSYAKAGQFSGTLDTSKQEVDSPSILEQIKSKF